jgi:hypothetical protein
MRKKGADQKRGWNSTHEREGRGKEKEESDRLFCKPDFEKRRRYTIDTFGNVKIGSPRRTDQSEQ